MTGQPEESLQKPSSGVQSHDLISMLQQAIESNQLNTVESFLTGSNIADLLKVRNGLGMTALYIAANMNNLPVVDLLLKYAEVEVDAQGSWIKDTPLHRAVICKNLKMVTALLDKGANMSALSGAGISALHQVTITKDPDILQELLSIATSQGIEHRTSEFSTISGRTALHLAVQNGWYGGVELLLQNGASLHARIENGENSAYQPSSCELAFDLASNTTKIQIGQRLAYIKILQLLLSQEQIKPTDMAAFNIYTKVEKKLKPEQATIYQEIIEAIKPKLSTQQLDRAQVSGLCRQNEAQEINYR